MKKKLLILLIIFINFNAFASLDSLESLLQDKEGVERAAVLYQISSTYQQIDPDKRLKYSREGYHLGQVFANDTIIAEFEKNIAISFLYKYELDSALHYFEMAADKFEKLKEIQNYAACLNNIGIIYWQNLDYKNATRIYLKALKLKEEIADSAGMAKIINNLGSIYYDWSDYRKALHYFNKSFKIYQAVNDSISLPSAYQNLSATNMNIGLKFIPLKYKIFENPAHIDNQYIIDDSSRYYLDKALHQIEQSIFLHEKYGLTKHYPNLYSYLGVIKAYYGETKIAMEYIKIAIDSLQNNPNQSLLVRNLINLGILNYRIGDIENAEILLKESIAIADMRNDFILLNDAYYSLMALYEDVSRYEEAYNLANKIIFIKDSVFNKQNMEKIIELETEYETHKIKDKILLANAEMQSLSNEKKYFVAIIILLAIAVILFSILFYFKMRSNKELNKKSKRLQAFNYELEETKKELTEANQTKDKFFSIISHDLKNPISSFKQVTAFLDEEFYNIDNEEKYEIIKELKKYSENLYNLLENLLTWSRTQRGNINYNPEYEDLHDIAKYTIDHLNVQAESKNIDIINNIRKRTVAYFDPNLTSTILRNLISNAIKYSHKHSKIEISLTNGDPNFYSIDVKDNGIGIEDNKLKKLFVVGRNITTNGTGNESGTGLGLIICKEFAQRQGGDINVKSKPGIGSTFSLMIKKESKFKEKSKASL